MKVLLQLQKQQFDAGIKSVKNSIIGLGRTVKQISGALIGGLGLTALVTQFKNTAQQLSVVRNTLENVSGSFSEYQGNIQYLDRISNEYGQDLIALTQGFAKFHAAAKQTNLTLDQEKDIFEALTRAAGAFHLSADQTANVMLAVEQMLSKGKVTAEELRRQLGNSLPGAFQIMAKAAGVSTAELDSLMKAGKVISEEVLPKFAEQLNITTSVANFDSLQSSLNRFKNSWVSFVDKSGFEDFFKNFVDKGTKSLNYLKEHFNGFKAVVVGSLAGIATGRIFQNFQNYGTSAIDAIENETKGYEKQVDQIKTANAAVIKEVDEMRTGFQQLDKTGRDVFGRTKQELRELGISYRNYNRFEKQDNTGWKEKVDKIKQAEQAQGRINELQEKIKDNNDKINSQTTTWGRLSLGVSNFAKSIQATLLNIASSAIAGAIIGLFAGLATYIANAAKEEKRLKNYIDDTKRAVEDTAKHAYTEQLVKMEQALKIAGDISQTEYQREKSLRYINGLLDDEKLSLEDCATNAAKVERVLGKWKDRILESAKAAAYWDKIVDLTSQAINLQQQIDELTESPAYKNENPNPYRGPYSGPSYNDSPLHKQAASLALQLTQTNQLIDYYNQKVSEGLKGEHPELWTDPNDEGTANTKKAAEGIKTAIDGYKKSLSALDEKLSKGDISLKKYNRDVNKLRADTLKTIQGYEGFEDVLEELGGDYEKLYASLSKVSNATKSPLETLREDIDKYLAKKKELDNLFKSGKIDEEGYIKSLGRLIEKYQGSIFGVDDLAKMLGQLGPKYQQAVDEMTSAMAQVSMFDDLEDYLKEQEKDIKKVMKDVLDDFEKYQDKLMEVSNLPRPKRKARDTFFDYRQTGTQNLTGSADMSHKYVDDLEKFKDKILDIKDAFGYLDPYLQNLLTAIEKKLADATKQAKELDDAAKFAELIEEIEDLKRVRYNDLFEGIAGSGGLGALEHFHQSVSSMRDELEALGDADDAWDAFGAGIGVLTSFAQAIDSVISAIETWQNVIKTLTILQEAQNTMQTAMSANKVASLAEEATAEGASAAATVAAENAKSAAVTKTAAALAGEAVAGAAASQASIPYIGPILAAAAAAAIAAMLATSMKGFAKGGIVGGDSTEGDKNVVRVNSGEAILTKQMQANLISMLRNGGTGGNVNFRIKGSDLVGVFQNYDKRLRG